MGWAWAPARNSIWPVERLSTPVTVWPLARRRSVRELPMKPAAPVMSTCMRLFLIGDGLAGGGVFFGADGGQTAADAEDVFDVLDIAGDHVEAGVGVVTPADGHLFEFGTHANGEGEDFDIVHIAVDFLFGEDGFGEGVAEEFEAALGVGDAGEADDGLDEVVEAAGADLAVDGLGFFDFGGIDGAGADDDVGVGAEEGEELVELVDGDFVVSVGEADDLAGGLLDAEADAASFARALGAADDDEAGDFGG